MVKIRLAKLGKRNAHFFRVVAIDEQKKNAGKALENLGFWNPQTEEKKINIERINEWVKNGAQISPTVKKLIA